MHLIDYKLILHSWIKKIKKIINKLNITLSENITIEKRKYFSAFPKRLFHF